MKMLNFIKKNWGVFVILIVSLISLTWFNNNEFIFGDDTTFPISLKNFSFLDNYFYVIQFKIPYSSISTLHLPFIMPLGIILKLIQIFNLPYSALVYQRVLIYYLLAGSGISMYLFFKLVFPRTSVLTKTMTSLIYMFNLFIMQLWFGLPHHIFLYSFFPLLFGLWVKWIDEKKSPFYAVLLAIFFLFLITPGYMNAPSVPLYTGIFSLYYFCSIILTKSWKQQTIFVITFFCVWFLFNLFWIAPVLYSIGDQWNINTQGSTFQQDMIGLFQSQIIPIKDIFFLQGNKVFTATYKDFRIIPWSYTYHNVLFKLMSLILPFIAFIGFLGKNSKRSLIFKILLIFLILLASSSYLPYGYIITQIFIKLKLALVYRSVYQRFMPLVTFFMVVFFGLGFSLILKFHMQRIARLIKNILLLALVFIYIFVFVFPFWNGKLYESTPILPSKTVTLPPYIREAASWLDKQEGQYNILPLPYLGGHSTFWWNNGQDGYYGAHPFVYLSTKSTLILDHNISLNSLVEKMTQKKLKNSRILNLFNIRYIVVHKDIMTKLADKKTKILYNSYISGIIDSKLSKINGLKPVKTFGQLTVYENIYWQPTIVYCAGDSKSSLADMIEKEYILDYCPETIKSVKRIDPTKISVKLNITKPTTLVLNQYYGRKWVMKTGDKSIGSKPYQQVLNSFYIDKRGRYDAVIEFKSQKVFYAASIISFSTFVLSLISLGYYKYLKRRKLDNNQ